MGTSKPSGADLRGRPAPPPVVAGELLRERGGAAVCQRWRGACDVLAVKGFRVGLSEQAAPTLKQLTPFTVLNTLDFVKQPWI